MHVTSKVLKMQKRKISVSRMISQCASFTVFSALIYVYTVQDNAISPPWMWHGCALCGPTVQFVHLVFSEQAMARLTQFSISSLVSLRNDFQLHASPAENLDYHIMLHWLDERRWHECICLHESHKMIEIAFHMVLFKKKKKSPNKIVTPTAHLLHTYEKKEKKIW